MSTAPPRTRPPIASSAGRVARGLGWGALLVVLAASGAGLAGLAWHAPGSAAREELTYTGDAVLLARLDTAQTSLQGIAADVQQLATEAKSALEEVTSADPARLQASLGRGDAIAAAIDEKARALRTSLADLPGDEPDAVLRYSNPALVRRAAILAAVDAATGLAGSWQAVANRAGDTSTLTALISEHDSTVLEGTQHGVDSKFKAAVTSIKAALRNNASKVLSKAIWRADVTLVRFPMNPSRSLTIGRTRLMFIRALLIPSTVPMKPITGSK